MSLISLLIVSYHIWETMALFSQSCFIMSLPLRDCCLVIFAGVSVYSDCNVSVCLEECVWSIGRSTLISAPLSPACCLKCAGLACPPSLSRPLHPHCLHSRALPLVPPTFPCPPPPLLCRSRHFSSRLHPSSLHDLELGAWGRGMCPRLRDEPSNTHTQLVFSVGRKQQYYGVKTDGCQFSSSSQ